MGVSQYNSRELEGMPKPPLPTMMLTGCFGCTINLRDYYKWLTHLWGSGLVTDRLQFLWGPLLLKDMAARYVTPEILLSQEYWGDTDISNGYHHRENTVTSNCYTVTSKYG
jgi:hypothetical protein